MAGKTQNVSLMWMKKNVHLDEPTSFLDHVFLGCTQLACKPDEIIVEECTKMFDSRSSAGAMKIYWCAKNHAKTVAWSDDMEGHARKSALSDM